MLTILRYKPKQRRLLLTELLPAFRTHNIEEFLRIDIIASPFVENITKIHLLVRRDLITNFLDHFLEFFAGEHLVEADIQFSHDIFKRLLLFNNMNIDSLDEILQSLVRLLLLKRIVVEIEVFRQFLCILVQDILDFGHLVLELAFFVPLFI